MIELKMKGTCKECPWVDILIHEVCGDIIARCKHEAVCKYYADETQWGIKQFETFTNAPIDNTTTDKKTP